MAPLSTVLGSDRAIEVNIAIMRAFVRLRGIMSTHKDLARKLDDLERKLGEHDQNFQAIFEAIRAQRTTSACSVRRSTANGPCGSSSLIASSQGMRQGGCQEKLGYWAANSPRPRQFFHSFRGVFGGFPCARRCARRRRQKVVPLIGRQPHRWWYRLTAGSTLVAFLFSKRCPTHRPLISCYNGP